MAFINTYFNVDITVLPPADPLQNQSIPRKHPFSSPDSFNILAAAPPHNILPKKLLLTSPKPGNLAVFVDDVSTAWYLKVEIAGGPWLCSITYSEERFELVDVKSWGSQMRDWKVRNSGFYCNGRQRRWYHDGAILAEDLSVGSQYELKILDHRFSLPLLIYWIAVKWCEKLNA